MAASAVGTALATVLGGLAAYLGAWRLAFAAPALAGGVLALLLARLPEPEGFTAEGREGPMVQIGRVFRRPWAVTVVGIATVEGAVILGFLTFLAPSLESIGFSPAVAGLAVGLYGLAVLGWTRAVKLVRTASEPPHSSSSGAACSPSVTPRVQWDTRSWVSASPRCWLAGGSPSCTPRCRPGPQR